MRLRSVIYARQSLDRSGEGAAVDRQVEQCQALAAARGWDVVEVVKDNDVSASTGKRRPGYERVLDLVRGGAVERVVVWHIDRLTRSMRDLEDVVELCERHGVGVATVSGELDLSSDTGRLLARILAAVARGEVERKGARQRAANLQRARRGVVGWTRRPFGYDKGPDGSVVVVEPEAEALRLAATHVIEGATLASVARELDAKGLTTTAGKPWNVTSVRRALLNPRYAGRAVSKGQDHGRGAWPVVIEAETQDRIADVLRDPRRRTQQGTTVKYLLTGLVVCGRCGERMYASPMTRQGHRWLVYRCRTTHLMRRLDLVDEVVTGVILERLARPDAAALFAADVDHDHLRAEAVDLRKRRDELADLLAEGLLSAAKVREQARVLSDRLQAVERQMAATSQGDPVAVLTAAGDVQAAWEGLSLQARRAVIETLVRVTILPAGKGQRFEPEQVQIEWRQ